MSAAVASSRLDSHVLVLNKLYMAIRIVSARRAFSMLVKDLAEVISIEEGQWQGYDFESWRDVSEMKLEYERNEEEWIKSVSFEIQIHRIVRLLNYDKIPKRSVRFNRRNLFARDSNRCQYCGKNFATSDLTLDHVIPKSKGGQTVWDNIVCACIACNAKKGGKSPEQAHMRLIKKPEKPKTHPLLEVKLGSPKYQSWKTFLDNAYWNVELR